ncbi:unnamed protein product [Adineta ricciae]|uniref:Uncharacterized protein n=1 Tax=Adineta ricciae TaxID=249248 RepID=A0A813ZTB5_ADIRI|nr:unnamed protein product [Adineta ricciae]
MYDIRTNGIFLIALNYMPDTTGELVEKKLTYSSRQWQAMFNVLMHIDEMKRFCFPLIRFLIKILSQQHMDIR